MNKITKIFGSLIVSAAALTSFSATSYAASAAEVSTQQTIKIEGLSAETLYNCTKLSWNKINSDGYIFLFRQTGDNVVCAALLPSGTSSYTDYFVSNDDCVYFLQTNIKVGNTTAFCKSDRLTVSRKAENFSADLDAKLTIGSGKVILSWNKMNAVGYKIYKNGEEIYDTKSNNVTTYTVNGKAFPWDEFVVKSYNNRGTIEESRALTTQSFTVTDSSGGKLDPKLTVANGKGILTWNKTDAAGYKIYAGNILVHDTKSNSVTTYTMSDSDLFESRDVTVKAYDQPFDAKLTLGNGKVTLSWNKIDASGYKIYMDGKEIYDTKSNNVTSYTVNGLKNYTYYEFVIKAYDDKGIVEESDTLYSTLLTTLLDCVRTDQNRSFTITNMQTASHSTSTVTLSDHDIEVMDKFIAEHFTDDMTDVYKFEEALKWINQNVKYASTAADWNLIGGKSYVDAIFTYKTGQCAQYNGALVSLMRYMGYDVNMILGWRGTNSSHWQHYWGEVEIDGLRYLIEAGNWGSSGSWHYFLCPYEYTDGRFLRY